MEGSARMKWGIICSIQDEQQIPEFIQCSTWLIRKLEESAVKLHFGHRFTDNPTFALHASPGSEECAKAIYEKIAEAYPGVCYVIHILPSKDSVEYHVLKKMSFNGALITQGVLAENALNHFDCYQLDEVIANMNQWIGRRLSQITARRTVDKYQLTINKPAVGRSGGGQFKTTTGGNAMPLMDCRLMSPFGGKGTFSGRGTNTTMPNDFDVPTAIVLHSQSDPSNHPFAYRYGGTQRRVDNESGHPAAQKSSSAPAQQLDGTEREKEVIVGGYPVNFNKFQIASLFTDFRPLNVQYIAAGESLVQFANKFHAAQIVANYNGRRYEDEGFQLEVRSSARENACKHIAAMKTKMAGLMLKVTTKKAAGKKSTETVADEKKQPISSVDVKKEVAKDLTNKIKERILKMADQNQQQK